MQKDNISAIYAFWGSEKLKYCLIFTWRKIVKHLIKGNQVAAQLPKKRSWRTTLKVE